MRIDAPEKEIPITDSKQLTHLKKGRPAGQIRLIC